MVVGSRRFVYTLTNGNSLLGGSILWCQRTRFFAHAFVHYFKHIRLYIVLTIFVRIFLRTLLRTYSSLIRTLVSVCFSFSLIPHWFLVSTRSHGQSVSQSLPSLLVENRSFEVLRTPLFSFVRFCFVPHFGFIRFDCQVLVF